MTLRDSVLFVTHLPSNYKVTLYQQIASRLTSSFCFVGSTAFDRSQDFVTSRLPQNSFLLSNTSWQNRNILSTLPKLVCHLCKNRPSIVVVNGWDLIEFFFCLLLKPILAFRLYLIIESHQPAPDHRSNISSIVPSISKLYKYIFLKYSDHIFFSSNLASDFYMKNFSFATSFDVINGVGLPSFYPLTHEPLPSELNLDYLQKYAVNLFSCSRYIPQKNIQTVLDAVSEHPTISYTHFGSGSASYLSLPSSGNCYLHGPLPNRLLPSLKGYFDYFVFFSILDAWGLAPEEANLLGIPCILSPSSGFASWSASNHCNHIAPDHSSTALSHILSLLPIPSIPSESLPNLVTYKNEQLLSILLQRLG